MRMQDRHRLFTLFLRVLGSVALLAVVAVVMPYSWMNGIHQWLGMGKLPAEPIVGYLARSTSAFYAILGGLLWVVSFDLRRHRVVLQYLGLAIVLFGITLGVVDFMGGMPRFWKLAEGPINVAIGVVILIFTVNQQTGPPDQAPFSRRPCPLPVESVAVAADPSSSLQCSIRRPAACVYGTD